MQRLFEIRLAVAVFTVKIEVLDLATLVTQITF